MGVGASEQPKHGVLPNPRLLYANDRSKKMKKDCSIDAPVLIDLGHGSIRYRYVNNESKTTKFKKKNEMPFEGDNTKIKGGYFYHPRLNDFSERASVDKEDPLRFMYVMKGPANAKQKKVFYVYGRGLDAKDGQLTKPVRSRAMGSDPTWPQRQNPNDVYYNLTFIPQVPTEDPIPGIPNRYQMQFAVNSNDTVKDLTIRIAHTIIKSPTNIHVCFRLNLLREDELISNLKGEEGQREEDQIEEDQSEVHVFGIHLTLMDH